MKVKLHAKLDQDTVTLLQKCRDITGYRHNDELIKFLATFAITSYLEARTRTLNEAKEASRENSGVSESSTGEASASSGGPAGPSEEG